MFTTRMLKNWNSQAPLLCGHRGHSVDGLENSRAALRAAVDRGASLCEVDLRVTADDRFVVFHDAALDHASTGTGPVRKHMLEDLRTLRHRRRAGGETSDALLSLEDLLAHASSMGVGLIIELKDRIDNDALFDRLLVALDDAGMREQVIVSSFDHVVLRTLKRRHSDIATLGIVHERHVDPVAVARAGLVDVYSVDFPHLEPAAAVDLRRAGVALAHFVPRPQFFEELDACGKEALETIATLLRSGNVAIFGCDDVAWGASFLKDIRA